MSKWTEDEIAFLHGDGAELTAEEIGRRLGRTTLSVKCKRQTLGRLVRRRWTDAELAVIREQYRKVPVPEIARQLGRTARSIWQAATKLGVTGKIAPRGKALETYLRQQHALGWSDREIADGWSTRHPDCLPVERHGIGDFRRRLGLAENTFSEHRIEQVRQKTREQIAAAGLKSLAEVRKKAFADFATARGWPADLRPRAVQILEAMFRLGPMTRRQIAAEIGMPWKGSRKSLVSNDKEGSYLAHLMARGLVVCLGRRIKGKGTGHSTCLYSLPLTTERDLPTQRRTG